MFVVVPILVTIGSCLASIIMANLLMQAESTRVIPLKLDEEILGRSGNCSVSIHSVIVSRRHAEFRRSGNTWSVKDLYSVNGVYVNHKKVEPPHACKLKSEDIISLGPIHRTDMAFQFMQIPDEHEAKLVSLNTVFWLSTPVNKLIYTPAGIANHGKYYSMNSTNKTKEPPLTESNEENEEEPNTEKVPVATSKASPEKNDTIPVASSVEGEEQDVVKRVESIMEEELTCSICSELFINAVTLSCGHNFCQMCIRSWRKKKDSCPICSSQIIQEIRSYVLDSVIKQLVSLNPHLKKNYEVRYKRYA